MLHCRLISISPFQLQPGVSLHHQGRDVVWELTVYLSLATFILGCGNIAAPVRIQPNSSPFSHFLNLLLSYRFFHPCSSDLSSHSAVLYLHHSHPAWNLPIWSMCCTPVEACWGSRNGKCLQSSEMGLSSVPTAQSPFSSIIAATSAAAHRLQYRFTQMQPLWV